MFDQSNEVLNNRQPFIIFTMRKILSLLCCFSAAVSAYSQVGINTTTPQAVLDISSKNISDPANIDGLLIPRINNFPAINPTSSQNSMLVYLNVATSPGSPFGINNTGFYYWSFPQLKWVSLDSSKFSWSTNGNSLIVDGINFIGTTDNVPLNFKVNNQKSGRITDSETFYGYRAGNVNTGNFNTAFGENALFNNTTAINNVAIGSNAIHDNTTGPENTAIGSKAMYGNTTAAANTAVGYEADTVPLSV